jgi:hypothetical protein
MAKSTKPTIRIHDLELNEVIDREMTDAEFADYQADQEAQAIAKAEAEAKETAKAAILDRIGLTADELKTILG